MLKKRPKICTGCRVSAAKVYLYHSSKIAKAKPHSVEGPEYTSVQSSGHPGFLQGFSLFICVKSNLSTNLEKLCDGVVNCFHAEDEDYNICKNENVFPDSATIECVENRPGYDITILAVPCNKVWECRDRSDEKCGGDIMGHNITLYFWATLLFLFVISFIIIYVIHYHINGTLIPPRRNVMAIVASYGPNVKSYTGNMLAFLKVSFLFDP